MIHVKVHLKEITKYVLLLGVAVQGLLAVIVAARWIWNAPSAGSRVNSVLGLGAGILLAALFLRVWCKRTWFRLYLWGITGIISIPVVLHTCLDAGAEFFRFMGVCAIILLYVGYRGRSRQNKHRILAVAVSLAAMLVLSCYGSSAPSVAARITSRCCFPYLYDEGYNIPTGLAEKLDDYVLHESFYTPEGLYTMLYPALVERHGSREAADEICLELAEYCVRKNTKGCVSNFLWDYAGYHFPTVVSQLQLQGAGYDSMTGVNYGQLVVRGGAVAMAYWDYGVVWYLLSTILLLLLGKECFKKRRPGIWLLFLEVSVLCFVMEGAGFFDYKNLPLAEFVRMGLLFGAFVDCIVEKDE